MAHAIVHWRGWLLVLDSQRGGLLRVDPNTGTHTTIWKVIQEGAIVCTAPAPRAC